MKIKLSVVAIILGISILNAENGDGSIVVNMKKAIVKLIGDSQEHDFKINEQGLEIQRLKTEINELKNSLNVQQRQPIVIKQEVKEYVVNTMNLNIRKEPSELSEKIGSLTIGTKINTNVSESGWLKLENGGFVKKEYLSETTFYSIKTNKQTKIWLIPSKHNEFILKEVEKNTSLNVVAKVYNNQWLLLEDGNYIRTVNARRK